jgi:hypothetical protein
VVQVPLKAVRSETILQAPADGTPRGA